MIKTIINRNKKKSIYGFSKYLLFNILYKFILQLLKNKERILKLLKEIYQNIYIIYKIKEVNFSY